MDLLTLLLMLLQVEAVELELPQELSMLLLTTDNHQSVEEQVLDLLQDKVLQLLMLVQDQEHLPPQETLHLSVTLI